MEQLDGPLEIVHNIPLAVGSLSESVADCAALSPVLVALIVYPIFVPAITPVESDVKVNPNLGAVGEGLYVNWSAVVVVDGPPCAVVTLMSTVPEAVAVGDVTVIEVPVELTLNLVVLFEPKLTDVVPRNPDPVMVTEVAPTSGPEFGETFVITGAYVKSSAVEVVIGEVPLALATVTTTVPVPAGDVALMTESLTTVNFADDAPKFTPDTPVNPVPVIVTGVPPSAGPLAGLRPETTGM